jgi:asparagine synthase (glutamine-hydrolysing)
LIDKRKRKIFLFNDRYGLERIYWHKQEDVFYFASEAKALLRVLPELREFDDHGVADFLAFGCPLEGRTLFKNIHLLPGGSVCSFENGKCRKQKYFSPDTWEAQPTVLAEDFEVEFQETFKRILPRYLLSDVRLAAQVAEACNLEHRILRIGPDFFSTFATQADRTVYITDGCFGILGAHEIYLNRQARHWAAVRLTGNYGSEVLRSISTFKPIRLMSELLSPEFRGSVNSCAEIMPRSKEHPVTFAAFKEIPWNLFGNLAAGRSQVTFRTPYLDNELVALAYRAPDCLRRSALPASRFVESNKPSLGEIPTDRGLMGNNSEVVRLLRRIFAETTCKIDYYNSEGLPFGLAPFDSILRHLSSGLGILGLHKFLPYRHWFRKELAPQIADILTDARVCRMRFWNPDVVSKLPADHISGRKNCIREINAVLTLEAVERLVIRGASDN